MKVGIVGCKGRVGQLLVRELLSGQHDGLEICGGTIAPEETAPNVNFPIFKDPVQLFKAADAVIDFTIPTATRQHIKLAEEHHTALIVGTTGLTAEDEALMHKAAKEVAILLSANMSIGVNLLCALVEQAAKSLDDGFDIEIVETHHKHKIDAPSGTAYALGKSAASGRNVSLKEKGIFERYGETGARKQGDIGFGTLRGGDVVGDHTVYFYGEGERIELTHRATNRSLFAKGALKATKWIERQEPGFYTMKDVLGL